MVARAALLALAIALGAAGPTLAETLYAEVVLNGQATEAVLAFESDEGGLSAEAARLVALGLRIPPGAVSPDGRVRLSALPGLTYTLRSADQVVELRVDASLLVTRVIAPEADYTPPDRAAWGALVNYSVYGVAPSRGRGGASATWEARLFGPPGAFTSSWYIQDYGSDLPGQRDGAVRRLDTYFVHDEPRPMRRWVAGDFIGASQTWSRPFRAAGISLATDFTLRPELITEPLPNLRGASSVPSTVDVYINGVQQLSEPASGPFEIRQPPVFNGTGQVSVVVTDVLGRQTVQSFAYYGSSQLLRPGLTDYAFDAGWLRMDYSGPRDRYTDGFAQISVRRGLTPSLTLEGRLAGSDSLVEAGGGVVFKVREWMVVGAGVNLTSGRLGEGGLWRLSAEHRNGHFSFYGAVSQTWGDYDDLARRAGDIPVELSIQAGVGYGTARLGNFNLNYTRQRSGPVQDYGVYNVSWTRSVGGGVELYVAGYASDRGLHASGVTVGFIMPLGRRGTAGGRVSSTSGGGEQATAYAWTPPPLDGGWGWRASLDVGDDSRFQGEVRYASRIGEATVGVDVDDQGVSARAFANGSVVWLARGNPRLAAAVGESFVMVDTDAPDIEIEHENRIIGRTGSDGRLLIPYVAPFAPTRIAISPGALPMDVEAARPEAFARAPRGAAVVVSLPVRPTRALYLRILMPGGAPIALGSQVQFEGLEPVVVGYDGLVWISGALGQAHATVAIPGDGVCAIDVGSAAEAGAPTEVVCHAP